jgi:hypothetical protein
MKEPIEFTDRERFVLSYYRDPQLSSWSSHVVREGIYVIFSVIFITLYLTQQDAGWGFVGYGILLWRVCWNVWQSRRYTEDFRSIFTKYDAKLRELTERAEGKEPAR